MTTHKLTKAFTLAILLSAVFAVQAQTFSNDFENGYTWYPPWTNIVLTTDSIAVDSLTHDSIPAAYQHFSLCDSTMEFGLGFSLPLDGIPLTGNLHVHYQADYQYPDATGYGELVFSVLKDDQTLVWQSQQLSEQADTGTEWFQSDFDIDLPADHLPGCVLNAYLWNPKKERIFIDNASLTLSTWQLPSFIPKLTAETAGDSLSFHLSSLTHPIGMLTEYLMDGDTVTDYQVFKMVRDNPEHYQTISAIDTTIVSLIQFQEGRNHHIAINTTFTRDCQLLRKALVIPFIDSTLTIYRRNLTVDTTMFQLEYYLDREGFQVGEGERCITSYHQTHVSSTQFDANHRVAYFNLDYWRDHPLIHYPMSDTISNYYEDHSFRDIEAGTHWTNWVTLHIGDPIQDLPRLMPIPYGYRAGIIFTEHADWTDIRTHRAVLFGNEHITKAKNATGGFVYYGIPVTKSVFYNNPDLVTNAEISEGRFPGLHATIKTDREFEKLLKQLHRIGFDICLHTPEQYTTTPRNLEEAMTYMRKQFQSSTWIDHGYNNGTKNNREDLVCDGLNPQSEAYSAKFWQANGIHYLWNAYYEENRLTPWCFDNNLMQPYPGFGDALPNRQITLLEPNNSQFSTLNSQLYTWCTPATFEAIDDKQWDYYFSEERLNNLINHHSVSITHIYPAWVKPGRTFWTYDEDSTIVARPGMNRALARIADFRERHEILPMTIKTYLDYYTSLLEVHYEILDSEHIRLSNSGKTIEGFTLLCTAPIRFKDNRYYEFRKAGDYYYVWFNLKPNDRVIIEIINNLEFRGLASNPSKF